MLFALAWLVAAALAVSVGLAAVNTVDEAARGRGPLGQEVQPLRADALQPLDGTPSPDPDRRRVQEALTEEFGTFVVACQGPLAVGVSVRANRQEGWQVLSFEPGPDEDVDALFTDGSRTAEIEVYCLQGRPTIDDIERSELTGPDDD